MKYLKISSLLVLSLLLFAPAALADVTCELRPNSQRIRMESENEELGAIMIRCTSEAASDITATTAIGGEESTFDLEVQFEGNLSNDDDMAPTLWLVDVTDPTEARDATVEEGVTTERAHDAMGNRLPAPMAEMDADTAVWENIEFPDTWVGTTESFTIAMVYIDVTSVSDDRLQATIEMDAANLDEDTVLTSDNEPVSIARVDQALNLEFAEDNKAATINACSPGEVEISVTLEEGFRGAWVDENDILLMVSSGSIEAKDSGVFDVTDEGGAGELIIDVEPTPSTDSMDLAITFEPEAGDAGDDLTLSAMLLPARRSEESFVVSSTLVVGSFGACTGDTLTFPFISNSNPFDTGIAIVNTSEVNGECELMWDGMEGETADVLRVRAMDTSVFVLSRENTDFQGFLKAACNFGGAYGYAYITDYSDARSGAQGYIVEGRQ